MINYKKIIFTGAIVLMTAGCTAQTNSTGSSASKSSDQPGMPSAVLPPNFHPPANQTNPPGAPIIIPASGTIQNQDWGSSSLILNIGTTSSTVSLVCSGGEITEPFNLEKGNNGAEVFSLKGNYHPGGPPRATINPITGEPETPNYNATYSGFIKNGSMHFVITPETGGQNQEYDLQPGKYTLPARPCAL